MSETLVTLGDAARELSIPYQTAYAAWHAGRIPFQRAGVAILVEVENVRQAFVSYRPRGTAIPKERTMR